MSPEWPTADANPSAAVDTAVRRTPGGPGGRSNKIVQLRDCPDCLLTDFDLVHSDLRDADLQRAQRQRANYGQARLDGADLQQSNLQFTTFEGRTCGEQICGGACFRA